LYAKKTLKGSASVTEKINSTMYPMLTMFTHLTVLRLTKPNVGMKETMTKKHMQISIIPKGSFLGDTVQFGATMPIKQNLKITNIVCKSDTKLH